MKKRAEAIWTRFPTTPSNKLRRVPPPGMVAVLCTALTSNGEILGYAGVLFSRARLLDVFEAFYHRLVPGALRRPRTNRGHPSSRLPAFRRRRFSSSRSTSDRSATTSKTNWRRRVVGRTQWAFSNLKRAVFITAPIVRVRVYRTPESNGSVGYMSFLRRRYVIFRRKTRSFRVVFF